jgi:hypothetical protein
MNSEISPEPERRDEPPRRSFWSLLPRRSLSRVLILLAMLAGILYLRQRTGSIAACMADAFHAPPPAASGVRVKLRVALPIDAGEKPTP